MRLRKEYLIGDASFYKKVFWVTTPIIIQNTITHVVNLLDNVMVGRLGTIQMSSVAIVNQLIFIFNLCIFGGLAAPGIFAVQFAGAKDDEGLRHCFRLKMIIASVIFLIVGILLGLFPEKLVGLYIADGTSPKDTAATINYALTYTKIMIASLLPYSISQVYAGSLRESGETKLPMYASSCAIFINLLFNYFLIFGKFGFPCLGVRGAAIATVFSRFAELFILLFFTYKKTDTFRFIKGVYKSFYIPLELCKKVMKKGAPLLLNEFLWSLALAFFLQCYSSRGLLCVAAANIASATQSIFNVVLIALGTSLAILVGQCLGANEIERAKKTVWRISTLSVVICIILGAVLALMSRVIPLAYNTEDEVRKIASSFIISIALILPFDAFAHIAYYTVRSGGKTALTCFLDSGLMWICGAPVAYFLANYTSINVAVVFFLARSVDIVKTIIGAILLRRGVWISNIVK